MADTLASILNPVASATGTSPSQSAGVTLKTTTDAATMAKNFDSFLTLLTTQLKNQNPLEPLDTNQFTQQLVQFTQVEQQMKMNTQLASLISIEQMAQSTAAMAYLGSTATVDGSTAKLERRQGGLDLRVRQAVERHDQHQEFDRRAGLFGQLHGQCRAAELPVGRPRQQRHQVSGRQLHARDLGQGYDRPVGGDLDHGVGHGRQRRPEREPADALDRRAELHHGQDQEGRAPGAVGPDRLILVLRSLAKLGLERMAPGDSGRSAILRGLLRRRSSP